MKSDFSEELFDFWVLMEWAHYHMKRIRERRLHAIGLSIAKMKILNIIYRVNTRNDKATPGMLVKQLLKAPSTVTERLNRLEAEGLITRTTDPDNRSIVFLELTEKGRKTVIQAREMRTLSRIISKIPHKKRLSVMNAFRVLLINARKENDLDS
ncbi:MarR family winged helix-turn-helix transcriptional regulator [Chloroflexota bacterium]